MRTAFRIAPLAALAALMITGSLSASHAANCETALKAHYRCSATFSDGGSSDYCVTTDVAAPGDGQFVLYEDGLARFFCTCEAKGRAPLVRFGASTRDFFCGSEYLALSGKATSTKLTGQGYDASSISGTRSMFTCQAVDTCP